MNGRKAKALRRAVGFHPADERSFKLARGGEKFSYSTMDRLMKWAGMGGRVVGTIVGVGPRSQYQALKSNPSMQRVVLINHA